MRTGLLTLGRGLWGALLAVRPQLVLDRVGGPSSAPLIVVTRLLGLRHLGEAAAVAASGGSAPPRWTLAVDGLHGASMVALAAVSRRYRRDALASAGMTGTLVVLSEWERRRA